MAKQFASATDFVQVWETSNSIEEVAQRLHMTRQSVYVRKSQLKKLGVALKDMNRKAHNKTDVDELNRLIGYLRFKKAGD